MSWNPYPRWGGLFCWKGYPFVRFPWKMFSFPMFWCWYGRHNKNLTLSTTRNTRFGNFLTEIEPMFQGFLQKRPIWAECPQIPYIKLANFASTKIKYESKYSFNHNISKFTVAATPRVPGEGGRGRGWVCVSWDLKGSRELKYSRKWRSGKLKFVLVSSKIKAIELKVIQNCANWALKC